MKTQLSKFLSSTAISLTFAIAGASVVAISNPTDAVASSHGGGGGGGGDGGGGGGGGGDHGQEEGDEHEGGKKGPQAGGGGHASSSTEDATSSDRPDWAGPNPSEPKPSGMGGGKPEGAGSMKGSVYGDLYDIEWLPVGTPDVDADGNPKVVAYVDTNGDGVGDMTLAEYLGLPEDSTVLIEWTNVGTAEEPEWELSSVATDVQTGNQYTDTADYSIVPGNVEFGRTSVARSPDSVFNRQLDELESLLDTATAVDIALDGRIVVTTAEGDVTIDSPLTNLAIYAVLMETSRDIELNAEDLETLKEAGVSAEALLAAAADKTGTITEDYVAFLNTALGVNTVETDNSTSPPTTEVTYLTFDPSETYSRTDIWSEAIINAVFGGDDGVVTTGIDAFSQEADDYLQVIEYLHENPDASF